ncbi:hypothetical protein ElyMa_005493600 [Elysia marginata]|uniref:Uncharacterized protein n=1 Tax=Elysia marginata TaxID=1093978 RepID=A0AAV4EUR1_9GAST|nr:hypothetical protein ElyMa_005493600 [Elysia marginata]
MMFILATMFVLALPLASCEVCFPPKAEYKVLTMVSLDDLYMACDYDQGKIILTPANDTKGDMWTLFDINTHRTYFQPEKGKCLFKECPSTKMMEKCLPEDAKLLKTIDNHDMYAMISPHGLGWVLGVTKIEGSEFYHKYLSRVSMYGSIMDIALSYQCSEEISDPSVFERDLSACKEVQLPPP